MSVRASVASVLAVVAGVAASAPAATIVRRSVDLRLDGPALVETLRLDVRLDEPGDLTAWSEYGIGLDEHISLDRLEARVLDAAGEVVGRVPRRRCREVTSTGYGLYTSQSTLVVPFPTLDVGQHLDLEIVRRIEPLFPAWQVVLDRDDPQQRLEVRIHGGGEGLRWELRAAEGVVDVERHDDGGVVLTGRDVARRDTPPYAGDGDWVRPSVRLAWGPATSWSDVAEWYRDLVAEVPRGNAAVAALAARLVDGVDSPRERLEALTSHVQRTIRYEAVEIGVGGWVPTPAHETLGRGWGDCKDMSELLAELLRAAGIPAHLTLIRNGFRGTIDPTFPASLGFNHCVVAVPEDAVERRPADSAADGFLILDPTVARGGAAWLNPYLQDQWGVVVGGPADPLVRVPVRADAEGRGLVVAGTVADDGGFTGRAVMRLFGVRALGWLRDMSSAPPDRIEETIRNWIEEIVPAARVRQVEWSELEGDVPGVELAAAVAVPRLVLGDPGRRRLRLASLSPLPEPRVLDERDEPVVLWPGQHRMVWRLALPEGWCPVRSEDRTEQNSAGSVTRLVETSPDGEAVIDLEVVVTRPRYETGSFEDLRALALAASRAERRSIRFVCDDDG